MSVALLLRPTACCHLNQHFHFPASICFYKIRANAGTQTTVWTCPPKDGNTATTQPTLTALQQMREAWIHCGKVVSIKVWLPEGQMHRSQGCLFTALAAPLSLFFFFLSFQIIRVLLSYKLPLTQQLKIMCSVLLGGYRPAGQSCWSGLVLAGLGCSSASVILLSAWLWAGRESSSGMASVTSWRWQSPLATGYMVPHSPAGQSFTRSKRTIGTRQA